MPTTATKKKANFFTQLCVWHGTIVGKKKISEFTKFMKDEFGARVKYVEEIKTQPDTDSIGREISGTGGRNDLFFYVHSEDIPKFAVPRLKAGIRWWEDVLGNGGGKLYNEETLSKYGR